MEQIFASLLQFGRLYVERPCAFCAAPGAPLGQAKAAFAAIPRGCLAKNVEAVESVVKPTATQTKTVNIVPCR